MGFSGSRFCGPAHTLLMGTTDFRELRVYQEAFESAVALFELSRRWPPEERFSLTDQIRRSSRSVAANIAEAWGKRRYRAAFILKLTDADAEARESIVHLGFACRHGYITRGEYGTHLAAYDGICAKLHRMMQRGGDWGLSGTE